MTPPPMGERKHSGTLVAKACLGLLLAWPAVAAAARPWPDTRQRIVPFADQLPNSLNATQRWFAATHFAGTQKMLQSEIQALRVYNTNFLCLHYQLAVGAGPAPDVAALRLSARVAQARALPARADWSPAVALDKL